MVNNIKYTINTVIKNQCTNHHPLCVETYPVKCFILKISSQNLPWESRYQASILLKYVGTSVSNTAAIYLKENLQCMYTIFSDKNHYFCRFLLFTY